MRPKNPLIAEMIAESNNRYSGSDDDADATKLCKECGEEKRKSEFHRRKASVDGLSAKCKSCQSTYDKARLNAPHRVKARNAYAKTKVGKAARVRANTAWRSKDKRRQACHNAVAKALMRGTMVRQGCERCEADVAEAHHDDYDKPLEVRWLCQVCHKQHHKEGKA